MPVLLAMDCIWYWPQQTNHFLFRMMFMFSITFAFTMGLVTSSVMTERRYKHLPGLYLNQSVSCHMEMVDSSVIQCVVSCQINRCMMFKKDGDGCFICPSSLSDAISLPANLPLDNIYYAGEWHAVWWYRKNPYPLKNYIVPNKWFPAPQQLPSRDLCDLTIGIGSWYHLMSHGNEVPGMRKIPTLPFHGFWQWSWNNCGYPPTFWDII